MTQNLESILGRIFNMPDEKITDDLSMKNLEIWDSLMHMNLVMTLEEAYSVELTMDEIMTIVDVASIREIISEKTG